jgi:hypothetical protein
MGHPIRIKEADIFFTKLLDKRLELVFQRSVGDVKGIESAKKDIREFKREFKEANKAEHVRFLKNASK